MEIREKKGLENLVADHFLAKEEMPLNDEFLDENLLFVNHTVPWFADIVNYLVLGGFPEDLNRASMDKLSEAKYYVWPYLWKHI